MPGRGRAPRRSSSSVRGAGPATMAATMAATGRPGAAIVSGTFCAAATVVKKKRASVALLVPVTVVASRVCWEVVVAGRMATTATVGGHLSLSKVIV